MSVRGHHEAAWLCAFVCAFVCVFMCAFVLCACLCLFDSVSLSLYADTSGGEFVYSNSGSTGPFQVRPPLTRLQGPVAENAVRNTAWRTQQDSWRSQAAVQHPLLENDRCHDENSFCEVVLVRSMWAAASQEIVHAVRVSECLWGGWAAFLCVSVSVGG
jgi:hypothetical protein